MMNERLLLRCARVLSAFFSPFYMTFAVFAFVLLHSFRRLLYVGFVPSVWGYLILLFMVASFTIIIPRASIALLRRMTKQSRWVMSQRQNRSVPYVMAILSYLACAIMLYTLKVPPYLQGVIVSSLVVLMLCAVLNVWWKVSVHMAALGMVAAAAGVFGVALNFNPLWFLCLLFLVSGAVGSSRMLLRQHTLPQVLWGFVLGVACSLYFFSKGFLMI